MLHGPNSGTELVSGVSTVVIDGFDARDCSISAAAFARLHALLFWATNGISMISAGSIAINNVWLGGQMSYGGNGANSYGAKIAYFQGLTGVNSITVTNSIIDFPSTGTGLAATGASVHAIAAIMHFTSAVAVATSITATNATIRGKLSSAAGQVQLHVLLADSTFTTGTLTIDGDSGVTSTTAPVIQQGPVTFTGAVSNTVISITGLACGDVNKPTSSCVHFASTLSGGSISVNGATRTIAGAVTTGEYVVVRFSAAVSGTDISIVGVQLTLSSVTCAGSLNIRVVYAVTNVAGKNAAGSTFNVSSMRIAGSATSSGGYVDQRAVSANAALTQYEIVEFSGNDFSCVILSTASHTSVPLFNVEQGMTLIGTAASSIVVRGNSVKGMSVTSSGSTIAHTCYCGTVPTQARPSSAACLTWLK
jgi:hypothetical protein